MIAYNHKAAKISVYVLLQCEAERRYDLLATEKYKTSLLNQRIEQANAYSSSQWNDNSKLCGLVTQQIDYR
jgi:hypothetical protein